jgi:hypothetical protein
MPHLSLQANRVSGSSLAGTRRSQGGLTEGNLRPTTRCSEGVPHIRSQGYHYRGGPRESWPSRLSRPGSSEDRRAAAGSPYSSPPHPGALRQDDDSQSPPPPSNAQAPCVSTLGSHPMLGSGNHHLALDCLHGQPGEGRLDVPPPCGVSLRARTEVSRGASCYHREPERYKLSSLTSRRRLS